MDSNDGKRWDAATARGFLQVNCGNVDGVPTYIPEVMEMVDANAEEDFYLLPGGLVGRKELIQRFPFASIGTTPERVFDRLGFCSTADCGLEMHPVQFLKGRREIWTESDHLWRAGDGWEDFRALVRTVRGFSSVLALGDIDEDTRIRGVMLGMRQMTLALTDAAPAPEPIAPAPTAPAPTDATAAPAPTDATAPTAAPAPDLQKVIRGIHVIAEWAAHNTG